MFAILNKPFIIIQTTPLGTDICIAHRSEKHTTEALRYRSHSFYTANTCILTLNMIYQQRRQFNQPLWLAYVDLKAAFDSVNCTALWQLLLSVGRSTPPDS